MAAEGPAPLAIIGIGCRLPGDATNPQKLWELLVSGSSAWSPVPADRWNEDAFYHPNADDNNGTHNHLGGHFLKQDVAAFDATFFNVLPQDASAMDPQQRLLLETTYEALESAGIPHDAVRGSNTSVHMAMFTRDYDRNIYKDTMDIPKYHVTGTGEAILSNRISHLFDLHGPSMTIDTGCSGGMTAVHQACQSLRAGETDLALAGGANLILSPDHMISMSNLHSGDGKCYSFDNRGNGYGRGEGIATLVIKRLDDAIRSGDPIRAVIRETAINQGGHNPGITLPNSEAQAALQMQTWKNMKVQPSQVDYIEAHGTGTTVGDAKELEAISKVFCYNRDSELFVGSIKSNIGHLESVSGLAALIKATMMLEHNSIPPSINFENSKPNLNLDQRKIKIPVSSQELSRSGRPVISVNSFGYGGTNAHAILERPPALTSAADLTNDTQTDYLENDSESHPRLFLLSAKSHLSLAGVISSLRDWTLGQQNDTFLSDLSHTLCERRSIFPCRFSCVSSSQKELSEMLAKGTKVDTSTRISPEIKVNFVFTGQGAQWARMGCELLSNSVVRSSMYQSKGILHALGAPWDLLEELSRESSESRLQVAELAQPVTTAVQIALVDLLRSLQITPTAVVGHSSGEIAAAYCAGYLSQYSALRASYHRGFSATISKRKGFPKGAMLAVGLGEEDLGGYLSNLKMGKASVACQNSPSSTTISGDQSAIIELSECLSKNDIFNRRLNVDTAYHSHHMQAAAGEYQASVGDLEVLQPSPHVKLFSSVTGCERNRGFDSDYWTSNLVSKVRFCDAIQELCRTQQMSARYAHSHQIFVEIGPHSALAGPVRECITEMPEQIPYDYNSALVRGTGAQQSLLTMVGKLFCRGYDVDLAAVGALDSSHSSAKVLYDLPSYSWDHSKRFWHESRISRNYRFRKYPYHDLLGTRMAESTTIEPRWRHMVGVAGLPWLSDHVVDGLIIFPGAGYLCMATEAARQLLKDQCPEQGLGRVVLKDISFLKALVIPEAPARVEVQLSFNPVRGTGDAFQSAQYHFSVASFSGDETWHENCRGLIAIDFKLPKLETMSSEAPIGTRKNNLQHFADSTPTVVARSELYGELDKLGNTYGRMFAGIDQLSMDDSHAECSMTVPDVASAMPSTYLCPHLIHPTTLDILMHSSLPLVNRKLGPGSVMPVHIEEVSISASIDNQAGRSLFASATLNSSGFRAAEADVIVHSTNQSDESSPVLSVSGMELRSLAASISDATEKPREICYELKWGTDVDFLTSKDLLIDNSLALSPEHKLRIMNQATSVYISRCLEAIHSQNLDVLEAYHELLLQWMQRHSSSAGIAHNPESESEVLDLASKQGVEGEFLTRLGPKLTDIMTAKANALHIMLEDDLLYRVYADDSSSRCYALMRQYVKHLCFKQADLSILEIGAGTAGATVSFLEAMQAEGTQPASYHFTDISAGFFDRAREKLEKWAGTVTFKTLDIERDPVQQGFQRGSYDVVLACNVLHATPSITDTLARARTLLKPGGTLLLIEVTNPQPYLNITFGTLPGWWKGADEGRVDGPFLSTSAWEKAFSDSSLSMQITAHDDVKSPVSSLMVGKAIVPITLSALPNIRLITQVDGSADVVAFAQAYATRLKADGYNVITSTWKEELESPVEINIVLDDGANPVLAGASPKTFLAVTSLLRESSKVLWISASNDDRNYNDPRKHLITGFSRTAHAENEDLRLVTVDIQRSISDDVPSVVKPLVDILRRSYGSAKSTTEREYVLKASTVLVPRVIPSETLNRVTSNDESSKITGTRTFKNTSTPLRLEIQKNSIAIQPIFVEDEAHRRPLGETEIEIDARAIGVPVDGPQSTLYEYAGEVMAIGRQVSHVNISDRVLSISPVPCASHPRVSSVLVRRIPDSMSYTTAAAIPAAFMTAYHALISISDLQPGQTILIDGITSHAGQAAVAVAAHLGAKVIGTTSTQRGLETSSQDCQLSSHHIVPREGYECTRALRNLLKHNRLDAVLAVSGSQISAEVVGLIKPFGTMVNIYTNGGASKTVLKMPPNITVSSFDLQSLLQAKPHYGPKLLREAVDMACSGLSIPTNIKVCKIQELSDCFKARKGGQETNKSVLGIEDTSQVKVFEPRRPTLRLAADATFIVAGGLGDLGKRFLRLMAKAGAKHLVTLSRRGVDPAEFAALQEELNDLGPNCQLYNLKCDVAQLSSVHSALEMIRSMRLPPVKGVVQAAVVLRDSTLDRLTKAIFDSLLVTKMHGTLNLQRVFGQDDLEFFIMLSSAVGVLGTSGQASYNAGNTVQDALAQFEEGSKCHYVSLNIGTIEGADATVGYTARIQALRRQGLIPITPDELLAFFEYTMTPELRDTGMHQLVIGFNTEPISQTTATNGMVHSPMFTHVREAAERKTEAGTGIQKMTFKDTLSELHSQEDILNFIAILIRNKLSDLVSIEAGEIDLSRSIFEFGLDSLVAIELRNWVTREFDAPLQSSEIMENQDLLALAMKVRSRSRPVKDSTETSNSENTSWSTPATPRSTSVDENNEEIIPSSLPQLPLPDLNDVLDQLLESRRVFASPEEVDETRMTAQNFENIDGPSLLEQLKETASASDTRHDSWEREVYTSRREPLQDYSTFFFGHLVDGAPIHTQTERAAIIAIAALDYKIQLESGPAQPDTLNEIVLCTKSNDWLFHTTREPHTGMDRLVRHSPNREIAVLRNGHVFQLSVPLEATFAMLEAAFAAITSAATSRVPALAALTSLDRDSWASYRETLLLKSANSDVINAVEGAAFIICLDDSASSTASERCTTFMLNDRSFSNRWLDKTVQFVVAANGVSALVGEHSKLDGLGVRQLCEATTEAIITHDPSKLATPSSSAIAVKELTFDIPSTIATRITTQQQACLEHYAPIACSTLTSPLLNKEHLLSARLPVNAIAHITILLAIRLFSQCFEPVWETVSLAPFDGGRIDWVQTVTPAVMDFFNAVPASMKALNEQTDVERQIKITDKENKGLRRLLRTAAATHTKLITRAAAGKGFVTPLYHLLGAAIKQQETQPDNSVSLPELFKTRAWLECDRHATPKRFKTDCLGSGSNFRMQEAGFLMPEEGSVFVHYEVRESEGYFVSQGRDEDVSKFAKCLRQAVEVIGAVI